MSHHKISGAAIATPPDAPFHEAVVAEKQDRKRQAATLLQQWSADTDGYDQEIWPLVKEELEELRMRCRE
jgi:hypothetical protein